MYNKPTILFVLVLLQARIVRFSRKKLHNVRSKSEIILLNGVQIVSILGCLVVHPLVGSVILGCLVVHPLVESVILGCLVVHPLVESVILGCLVVHPRVGSVIPG